MEQLYYVAIWSNSAGHIFSGLFESPEAFLQDYALDSIESAEYAGYKLHECTSVASKVRS